MSTSLSVTSDGRHSVRCFRHRNANTFLTYSKCPLEPEFIGEHLFRLTKDFEPAYILVVRETHADGTWHCHALLQCIKPVTTRDERYFDIDRYHPNIQSAKSTDKVRDYILKDPKDKWEKGNYIPRKKSFVPPGKEPAEKRPSKDEVMKEIMTHATSREEYLSLVQSSLPYDWATKLSYFEYSASRLFPDIAEPFTSPHPASDPDLLCNETLQDWLEPNIYQITPGARKTSLYIVGPTRTGKTSWARSLGRHNYWQNNIDWSSYDEEALYNVVDDIPFKFCPCWKQLVGCQTDYIVNPKYGKRRKVAKKSIPTIILANEDEDWLKEMTPAQYDYFYANCQIYVMQAGEKWYTPA
nr:replication-associated protein [Panicum streak virus]